MKLYFLIFSFYYKMLVTKIIFYVSISVPVFFYTSIQINNELFYAEIGLIINTFQRIYFKSPYVPLIISSDSNTLVYLCMF